MPPRLPENVPSWAQDIIITCVIGPLVSSIIVAIRVWTRIYVTRNLGPDDYAAMMTLLFCIAFSVVLGVSTEFGMGLHLKDVSPNFRLSLTNQLSFSLSCDQHLTGRILSQARIMSQTMFHDFATYNYQEMLTQVTPIDDAGAAE